MNVQIWVGGSSPAMTLLMFFHAGHSGIRPDMVNEEETFADFDLDSVPAITPGRVSVKKKSKRRSVCATDLPRDGQPTSPTGILC